MPIEYTPSQQNNHIMSGNFITFLFIKWLKLEKANIIKVNYIQTQLENSVSFSINKCLELIYDILSVLQKKF